VIHLLPPLLCAAALLIFVGMIELKQRVVAWLEQAHAYRTLPGHGAWGVRRRANGHVEVTLGRWVFTTEPK
jgi:hypothetical protein